MTTLKAWQAFHTAESAAPYLSSAFVNARFEFRDKFLAGQPEPRERWKQAVAFAEEAMGDAIGRDYVRLNFPPESKARIEKLVADLLAAMKVRIAGATWMSPVTRTKAQEKLSKFRVLVGYPGQWRDYSALDVRRGDTFGNARRISRFNWDRQRARIGRPVDKAEWTINPQTLNAVYSKVRNRIVFPAAILQPPFFDPGADPAVNYGAIGGIIGHEISHALDDQGRKFDGDGRLRNWWTDEDAAASETREAKLPAQFEAYQFPQLEGLRINGRNTIGENMADLGGLVVALEGYRMSLGKVPAPAIDGFTGEQRLFLGWTQAFREITRDEALRQRLAASSYAPNQVRAFAPLRNIDA